MHGIVVKAVRGTLLALWFSYALTYPPATAQETLYHHRNVYGSTIDLSDWPQALLESCVFYGEPAANKVPGIENLISALQQGPALGAYLLEAVPATPALCLDDTADGTYSYLDLKNNLILVKTFLNFEQQSLFLVHELRHLEVANKGLIPSIDYGQKGMAAAVLASEADAQAVTTLYAWQLKSTGQPELWTALTQLDMYVDIALAFEQAMVARGDEYLATRAAFKQWYARKERVFPYYTLACISYFDKVRAEGEAQTSQSLPVHFFEHLCILPGGDSYDCHLIEGLAMPSN